MKSLTEPSLMFWAPSFAIFERDCILASRKFLPLVNILERISSNVCKKIENTWLTSSTTDISIEKFCFFFCTTHVVEFSDKTWYMNWVEYVFHSSPAGFGPMNRVMIWWKKIRISGSTQYECKEGGLLGLFGFPEIFCSDLCFLLPHRKNLRSARVHKFNLLKNFCF